MYFDCVCCSVLEMRVESSMSWMDPNKFFDMYLAGRAKRTFPTYNIAFWKLWVQGLDIGKLPFWWNDLEFAGHLVLFNKIEASVNMIKQASAVMTLLNEIVGLERVMGSSMARKVKKGCMRSRGNIRNGRKGSLAI